MTKALLFALVAFSVLSQAPAALGGTASFTGGILSYGAAGGEANRVFMIGVSGGFRVIDTTATVTAGTGCTQINAGEALCASPPTGFDIDVALGDMDDFVKVSKDAFTPSYTVAHLDGGAGDDELEGAFGRNILDGGPGADIFHAAAASTFLGDVVDYSDRTAPVTVTLGDDLPNDGESGEDDLIETGIHEVWGGTAGDVLSSAADETVLRGGPANDTITFQQTFDPSAFGGPGDDSITFSGSTFDTQVRGNAGDDVITATGQGSFQVIIGGAGDDTIDGGGGHDVISGGTGDDRLVGGAGHDYLVGNWGADTIVARDGFRDRVHGQDGHDRARVDHLDRISEVEELF